MEETSEGGQDFMSHRHRRGGGGGGETWKLYWWLSRSM
jgi:hypothetical protein